MLQFFGKSLIPRGAILMWYGTIATIPSGYALCDGNNGTPDLRNKFIVCADADQAGQAKTTILGSAQKSGGDTQHYHEISGGSTAVYTTQDIGTNIAAGSDYGDMAFGYCEGETSQNNVTAPPFYALAYIMKL